MVDIIIIVAVALMVGAAVFYIVKEKKSGRHCIGCPSSGSCTACHCNDKNAKKTKK